MVGGFVVHQKKSHIFAMWLVVLTWLVSVVFLVSGQCFSWPLASGFLRSVTSGS